MQKPLLWFHTTIYKHVVYFLHVLPFLGHPKGSIQQRNTHVITQISKLSISEQNSPEDNPFSELLHNTQLKYACAVKTYGFRLLPTPTHSQYAFIHSDINDTWYKIRTIRPVVLILTVYFCTHLYISLFWIFQNISLKKRMISAIDICNYYDIHLY